MNNTNTIGSKIKYLRKSEGYTQDELALKLQKDRSTIANYESNKKTPPLDVLIKICKIFKVSSHYFIEHNNEQIEIPEKFIDSKTARSYLYRHAIIDKKILDKLTENELVHFANEIQNFIELLTYKYKELIRNK